MKETNVLKALPANPGEDKEISNEVSQINQIIESLRDSLNELEVRISPILESKKEKPQELCEETSQCLLGSELRDIRLRLQSLLYLSNDVLNRIRL